MWTFFTKKFIVNWANWLFKSLSVPLSTSSGKALGNGAAKVPGWHEAFMFFCMWTLPACHHNRKVLTLPPHSWCLCISVCLSGSVWVDKREETVSVASWSGELCHEVCGEPDLTDCLPHFCYNLNPAVMLVVEPELRTDEVVKNTQPFVGLLVTAISL